mmetsp:Transcript_2047/g.3270  ORF Transcript_2047/g.3270 Transcript_2047/m.3270 type:complete len:88 (-) Transcript_2047:151-414(-)
MRAEHGRVLGPSGHMRRARGAPFLLPSSAAVVGMQIIISRGGEICGANDGGEKQPEQWWGAKMPRRVANNQMMKLKTPVQFSDIHHH